MSTLYGIRDQLGVSLDDVFRVHEDELTEAAMGAESPGRFRGPLVHPAERHVVELASGVIWERLTSHQHEDVDFLHVIYDVGGSSAPDERLMRHSGREYGYVLSGRLGVQLGFERHELGPGDSIAFDSTTPTDSGTSATKPCTVWFVVGRSG